MLFFQYEWFPSPQNTTCLMKCSAMFLSFQPRLHSSNHPFLQGKKIFVQLSTLISKGFKKPLSVNNTMPSLFSPPQTQVSFPTIGMTILLLSPTLMIRRKVSANHSYKAMYNFKTLKDQSYSQTTSSITGEGGKPT